MAPCRKDMLKLDAFYRRYHKRNLKMIGNAHEGYADEVRRRVQDKERAM
jgi:hypothetical protein